MPRDFDLDFDDEDLMQPRRQSMPRQQAPRQQQMPRQQMQGGGAGMATAPLRTPSRKKKNQTRSIIILAVEVVLFIALLVLFFVLKNKIAGGDAAKEAKEATEGSAEAGGSGESSGGVNVDGPNFTLTCTKVQLANDVDGNPAALIYFTFVNKTDAPLSMDEVFTPSVKQAGVDCSIDAQLTEMPDEVANHYAQIQGGASTECCYAISLQDFTSTLTLTIHDNYETFSDIGSTDIPLS